MWPIGANWIIIDVETNYIKDKNVTCIYNFWQKINDWIIHGFEILKTNVKHISKTRKKFYMEISKVILKLLNKIKKN